MLKRMSRAELLDGLDKLETELMKISLSVLLGGDIEIATRVRNQVEVTHNAILFVKATPDNGSEARTSEATATQEPKETPNAPASAERAWNKTIDSRPTSKDGRFVAVLRETEESLAIGAVLNIPGAFSPETYPYWTKLPELPEGVSLGKFA